MGSTSGTNEFMDAGRLPHIRVSAMKQLTQGFNFVVSLNEFTYGFQSVSGLSIKNNVEYIKEGGVNDHLIMVAEPQDDRPTLTFKRGVMMKSSSVATNLLKAAAARIPINLLRKAAMIGVNALDPQEALESGPAIGFIRVYSRERKLRALYSFLSLGMINWELDDLDANDGKVLIESITIAHTGLTRLPMALPSIFGVISSTLASDSEIAKEAAAAEKRAQEFTQAAKNLKDKQDDERKSREEQRKLWEKQLLEEKALWEKQQKENEALKEEKRKKKELEEELRKEEEKKAVEERKEQAEQRRKESEARRAAAEEAKNKHQEALNQDGETPDGENTI